MRIPEPVPFTLNAYLAFRAILLCARKNNLQSIACPGLATGIGGMNAQRCALQMRMAYDQVVSPARTPSFVRVHSLHQPMLRG